MYICLLLNAVCKLVKIMLVFLYSNKRHLFILKQVLSYYDRL